MAKKVFITAIVVLFSGVSAHAKIDVHTRMKTAYCMGFLTQEMNNPKLNPDRLLSARERVLALRPVFERAAHESEGTLAATAMDMEFKHGENVRERLSIAIEYFPMLEVCNQLVDQFRKQ